MRKGKSGFARLGGKCRFYWDCCRYGFRSEVDTMFPLYIDKYIELVDLRARFNNLLEDNETNNALILAQEQKISELRVELEDIQAKEPPDCEIIYTLEKLYFN